MRYLYNEFRNDYAVLRKEPQSEAECKKMIQILESLKADAEQAQVALKKFSATCSKNQSPFAQVSNRISGEIDSLLLGDIAKNLDSLKADLRSPYPIWEKWK